MIRVAVCDDDSLFLSKLEAVVRDCYARNRVFAQVQGFYKSQALLYELEDGERFDLLLLDIEMPMVDGMELAAKARQFLPDVLVIFFTSHMEYALDAYELSVFRYIPKQQGLLDNSRLTHALLDAAKRIEVQLRDFYLIQNQNRLERIPIKNILYITHEGKNAVLVTDIRNEEKQESRFRVRKTLQQVWEELPGEEFLFIDRGCIVNLSKVMSVREDCCILTDQTRLSVSQARMGNLKERLMGFWKERM